MGIVNNEKIKISDAKYLYKILPKELRSEYSIGIHGFDGWGRYWQKTEDGKYQLNENKIQETKKLILRHGLKFQGGRKLLSTVMFDKLSDYVTREGYYSAGGVVIALPKVLKSEDGEEMFLGAPNESSKNKQWDRNYQPTSLSEVVLPEDGLLNSMFIIGTYTKNDDGIEVTLNPNHIAFNKGVVSNEYFKEKQDKLSQMISYGEIDDSILPTGRANVSLIELGKKSYQHFGSKIAEKLKETVNALKSKLFSKDIDKAKDLDDRR